MSGVDNSTVAVHELTEGVIVGGGAGLVVLQPGRKLGDDHALQMDSGFFDFAVVDRRVVAAEAAERVGRQRASVAVRA